LTEPVVFSSLEEAAMKRTALTLVGALLLAGTVPRAHHGYADFFMDRAVEVEGQVESFRWANPHVVLTIRTADSIVYTAAFHQGASYFERRETSFSSPSGQAAAADPRNNYYPLNSWSIRIGDRVVVVASPPRDAASRELVTIKEVRRPRDGWVWRRLNPASETRNE
jgi:hypothetical protein